MVGFCTKPRVSRGNRRRRWRQFHGDESRERDTSLLRRLIFSDRQPRRSFLDYRRIRYRVAFAQSFIVRDTLKPRRRVHGFDPGSGDSKTNRPNTYSPRLLPTSYKLVPVESRLPPPVPVTLFALAQKIIGRNQTRAAPM